MLIEPQLESLRLPIVISPSNHLDATLGLSFEETISTDDSGTVQIKKMVRRYFQWEGVWEEGMRVKR